MKKYFLVLILTILAAYFAFAGGAGEGQNIVTRDTAGRLNVTTTIFPPFDFVRQVAGDKVNLTMLLTPGLESHSFEPSPMDIITIQNSGLFIHIGGEPWVERILQSINTDNMKIVAMTSFVELLHEEIIEGMEDHHNVPQRRGLFARLFPFLSGSNDNDHCELFFDEHVWTSPKNVKLIIPAITELLCEIDSANAWYYRQNAAAYIETLRELDTALEDLVAGAKRRTIVFSDRFPFRYLTYHYGLEYFAAFAGCSVQTDPSAATVAFLINKIRTEQIPVVFHLELSSERVADTISRETGAKKLLLHAAHNVSRNEFNAGVTYIDIMRQNIENLRVALY